MKTVRFASVVEQSGQPEVYLLLVDPKKDPDFQRALKEHRVMTLQPGGAGGKTQVGTPGYAPGPQAQVVVFPRPLKISPEAQVVGIKFELLHAELEAPSRETEKKPEAKSAPKEKSAPAPDKKAPHAKPVPAKTEEPKKLLPFAGPKKDEPDEDEELAPATSKAPDKKAGEMEIAELHAGIRRALKALEAGKQVAAFNTLKGLVEE